MPQNKNLDPHVAICRIAAGAMGAPRVELI
jgi:hypothetical protein